MLHRALQNIYSQNFHPATDIEINLFDEICNKIDEATQKGFDESGAVDPDDDFRAAILRNNEVFAAFKVHRMQNDMARLLLDSNGNLKPFEQWQKEVMPIASHQVGHWLRTEYDTAVLRAHQAADWQQFEREKDVLPNLRWMPSTSVNPGKDHMVFWGTVRPIDDPFWSQHRPGDRWNCKCDLSSTDDPVTEIPDFTTNDNPHPGLDNNPGKDGKLFSDTHPYIANAYPGAKKAVKKLMAQLDKSKAMKIRRKEIQREAASLKNESFLNRHFEYPIHISGRGIKEWLNQPHKFYEAKNEMLLSIKEVLKEAKYLGYGPDKHDLSVKAHLFEVKLRGEKSWIVVREFSPNKVEVHSISDSENIKNIITKKPDNL